MLLELPWSWLKTSLDELPACHLMHLSPPSLFQYDSTSHGPSRYLSSSGLLSWFSNPSMRRIKPWPQGWWQFVGTSWSLCCLATSLSGTSGKPEIPGCHHIQWAGPLITQCLQEKPNKEILQEHIWNHIVGIELPRLSTICVNRLGKKAV